MLELDLGLLPLLAPEIVLLVFDDRLGVFGVHVDVADGLDRLILVVLPDEVAHGYIGGGLRSLDSLESPVKSILLEVERVQLVLKLLVGHNFFVLLNLLFVDGQHHDIDRLFIPDGFDVDFFDLLFLVELVDLGSCDADAQVLWSFTFLDELDVP